MAIISSAWWRSLIANGTGVGGQPDPHFPRSMASAQVMVELVRRYSNRAELCERLEQAALRADDRAKEVSERTVVADVTDRASRVWRLQHRLSDDELQALV